MLGAKQLTVAIDFHCMERERIYIYIHILCKSMATSNCLRDWVYPRRNIWEAGDFRKSCSFVLHLIVFLSRRSKWDIDISISLSVLVLNSRFLRLWHFHLLKKLIKLQIQQRSCCFYEMSMCQQMLDIKCDKFKASKVVWCAVSKFKSSKINWVLLWNLCEE